MQKKSTFIFIAQLLFIFVSLLSLPSKAVGAYLLGPRDVVRITVYNQPDLSIEAQITDRGTITFPLIGEVQIGNLEKGAAEVLLADKLRDGGFIKQPQVNLLITQYRSQQVSVLGFINKPGKYSIDSVSYITDLLSQAGGIAPDGADVATLVRKDRDGKVTKYSIDLVKLFDASDVTQNYEVSDGDIIYVGRAPVFYIYGEVQKPGGYRLQRGMNIMQAISVGGGLTPKGTERGMYLNRSDDGGKVEALAVNAATPLKENDVVYIKQRLF